MLRVPLRGGDPEILTGVQTPRPELTLSDTHVYFYDGSQTLRRVSREGGMAETLYQEPDPDADLRRIHVGDGFVVFERAGSWATDGFFAIGIDP